MANDKKICLILLAVCIYMSTTYGFGTPIATIKANGGDAKHALKVIENSS